MYENPQMNNMESNVYSEDAGDSQFGFSDKTIRRGFIRKVFSILMLQLLVTFGIICLFQFCEPVGDYVKTNQWVWITAMVLTFVFIIILACCSNVRRKYPLNLAFLGAFTLCEGVFLGTVTIFYNVQQVMIAVGITVVICFGLILFALQTKFDFTAWGGALLVVLLCLFCFGILAVIFQNQILNMVYSCCGALVFGLYLVFDVQIMLGGRHKYALSPEEYIFAALNLYLDIINIFMYVLSIVGAVSD